VPVTWAHGRRERQVLGCGARIAGPGERQAESELGIIIARAGVHDQPEVSGGSRILAGVELRPGQRLQYAPGPRLSCSGPLEQLRGGRRTAAAEKVQAALVELMGVSTISGYRIGSVL
jgi:hypothetical protein